MSQPTISEKLFEQYCRDLSIPCESIETEEGVRTPDYQQTLAGHQVIVEVKQIDPNDEEVRLMKQFEERGIYRCVRRRARTPRSRSTQHGSETSTLDTRGLKRRWTASFRIGVRREREPHKS